MLNEKTKLPSPAGVVTEGCIPTRNSQRAQGARCRITASSWPGLYRAVLPRQGPSVLRGRCCRNIPFQISPRQGAWWHWGTWLAWLSVPGWLQHPPSKIVDVMVSPGHSGMGGFSETTLTKLTFPWQKCPLIGREVSWAQLSEVQLTGHHCSN